MTSRQEVAEKLRQAGERLRGSCCSGAAVFVTVKDIIGISKVINRKAFFDRLADLIDPTCRIVYADESWDSPDVGHIDEWHYECSRCRYELNDGEMDEFEGGALPFSYCPNCGARVVRDEA